MRSKTYRIGINPLPWQRTVRNINRHYGNDAKERVSFALYLAQQHNEEPFFTKAINLEVIFFMPFPKTQKNKDDLVYHSGAPSINDLYKFLLHSLKDVVIADENVICSVSLKKVYDNEPRTEMTITEVV